jgi:predicted methyltransferase
MRKTVFLMAALLVSGLSFAHLASAAGNERLAEVLAAQPDEVQARYQYRHPAETLEFFGIEPGMTVVDTLPGDGWYTKILLPYLGKDGAVIGADYAEGLWRAIGYDSDEFLATRKTWISDWTADAESWRTDGSASVDAFVLGSLPAAMHGTADVVLFVRALHNMAYPTPDARHLAEAIKNSYDILKPGGIVGIVQHEARENMPDDWADGENGYLKKSYVIEMMEDAGFELAGETAINANDRDVPTTDEHVWRLPPSNDGADTPEQKAQAAAIGESNRMTLKFRKPGM